MFCTQASKRVVFLAMGQGIHAQNIHVMALGKLVKESFEPHGRIRFAFRPQTTRAFTADSNARMFVAQFGSGVRQTPDRRENALGVWHLSYI